MARAAVYVVLLLACLVALPFIPPTSPPFTLVSGFATGVGVVLVDLAVARWRYLRLAWHAVRRPREIMRISVSYLFRIKVDSVYLLIRGTRFLQFQPVGGVYKYSPCATAFLHSIDALDDDLVPLDERSHQDLRIRIPGRHLIAFVRWFESGRCRETAPWREFHEELVRPGILPAKVFPWVFHDHVRRHVNRIWISQFAACKELLIADIQELRPNAAQLDALRALKGQQHPDIVWATEDQIRRHGVIPGREQDVAISHSAVWIL